MWRWRAWARAWTSRRSKESSCRSRTWVRWRSSWRRWAAVWRAWRSWALRAAGSWGRAWRGSLGVAEFGVFGGASGWCRGRSWVYVRPVGGRSSSKASLRSDLVHEVWTAIEQTQPESACAACSQRRARRRRVSSGRVRRGVPIPAGSWLPRQKRPCLESAMNRSSTDHEAAVCVRDKAHHTLHGLSSISAVFAGLRVCGMRL